MEFLRKWPIIIFSLLFVLITNLPYTVYGDIEPHPSYDEPTMNAKQLTQSSTNAGQGDAQYANAGFVHAFIASLSVIVVSELGDKTFFIAAIMAMRHSRAIVFGGAIFALGLMTVLSAVFGMAATFIPRVYTYYISTALFAIFGLKMLRDGYYMSPTDAQEELEEVQSDLKKREDELLRSINERNGKRKVDEPDVPNVHGVGCSSGGGGGGGSNGGGGDDNEDTNDNKQLPSSQINGVFGNGGGGSCGSIENCAIELKPLKKTANRRYEKETMTTVIQDPESGVIRKKPNKSIRFLHSRILMQAFTMTFLAEWGDRSQLTTIILGAREDIYGVVVGGVLGHSFCTGLAVIGGRMIAQRISVRTVTLVGGVVFLLFALSALFISPHEEGAKISSP